MCQRGRTNENDAKSTTRPAFSFFLHFLPPLSMFLFSCLLIWWWNGERSSNNLIWRLFCFVDHRINLLPSSSQAERDRRGKVLGSSTRVSRVTGEEESVVVFKSGEKKIVKDDEEGQGSQVSKHTHSTKEVENKRR